MYLLLLGLLLGFNLPVQAEPRMALLIGNGKGYPPLSEVNILGPLPEPELDVDLLRGVLQANGFAIPDEFVLKNASKQDMEDTVLRFAAKMADLGEGATALFFYAGHGVQGMDAQNYLIPVGGSFATNTDVVYRGVSAQWVLDTIAPPDIQRTGITIVLLDACRNSMPLKVSHRGGNLPNGFAQMNAQGAIIGYATSPNGKAHGEGKNGNGLYTKYLARALEAHKHWPLTIVLGEVATQVDKAARDVKYRQTPWFNSGLVGGGHLFCLVPPCQIGGNDEQTELLAAEIQRLKAQLAQQQTVEVVPPVPVVPSSPERLPYEPEMVDIPAGSFAMGSPDSEAGRSGDEGPVHRVHVKAFRMGKYEVTNAQFRKFRPGHNSGEYNGHSLNADNQPVVNVSWEDAVKYTEWLSQQTGKSYRLPSEAEWEYAVRAGTSTARFWGDNSDQACQYGNVHDETSKAKLGFSWTHHNCDDGYAVSAPVGSYSPNPWGLYDMLGNVWEWNQDKWHDNYDGAPTDGSAWESGGSSSRLLRGCSWDTVPDNCRAANRGSVSNPLNSFGFRVVFGVAWRAF